MRHFDEVMSDVASFLPPALFSELGEVICKEIEDEIEACFVEPRDPDTLYTDINEN